MQGRYTPTIEERELPFALILTLIPQILSELIPEMGTVSIPYSARGSNSTKASTTIPPYYFTDGLICSVNHTQLVQVIWPVPVLWDNKDLRAFFHQRMIVRQTR